MEKQKTIDLTTGPILGTLTKLAVPIMASSFLATAYNITDMAWIGKLGSKAVAGVGVGGMYVWLSQGLVSLARMGGQVNAAQCCGMNDRKRAAQYADASIRLTVLLALLFSAVCILFADPLISFFNLDDSETTHAAKVYLLITCGLIIFPFLTQTLTGLFTAQGDSRTPFLANLAGLVINMILDPVLILGIGPFPRLEVTGAAIATVTAQILVFLVLVIGIFRSAPGENILREIHLRDKIPANCYRSIFRIGVPTALQGTVYCMISMVLTRMVSAFGPGAVATQRVGGQIESLSWNTADGFGAALNAFTAQNYGAKKPERIRKGYDISFSILLVWGLLISALFVFFPRTVSELFFHEADVIEIAAEYMVIIGYGEAFMCIELMTVGALSGLGRTRLCSVISILCTGLRIPLAMILTGAGMGLAGIWWALTISSMIKGVLFYGTFRRISGKMQSMSSPA